MVKGSMLIRILKWVEGVDVMYDFALLLATITMIETVLYVHLYVYIA